VLLEFAWHPEAISIRLSIEYRHSKLSFARLRTDGVLERPEQGLMSLEIVEPLT